MIKFHLGNKGSGANGAGFERNGGDAIKSGRSVFFRSVLLILLILGITFLYPIEKIYLPLDIPSLGEVAPDDIISPFDFPIYKSPEELEHEKQVILANLKPVLKFDTLESGVVLREIRDWFERLENIQMTALSVEEKLAAIKASNPSLTQSTLNQLLIKKSYQQIKNTALAALDSLIAGGIVNDRNTLPLKNSALAIINYGDSSKTLMRESLPDTNTIRTQAMERAASLAGKNPDIAAAAAEIAAMFAKPNLVFDKQATEQNRITELANMPLTKGMVFSGEKIINAGERVSEFHRDVLVSLAKYRSQVNPGRGLWEILLPLLGRIFFVAFPIVFFYQYLYYFKKGVFASNGDLLLFGILFAGEVVLLHVIMSQSFLSPYLVPLAIASMLTTILFDEEIGVAMTTSLAMLVGVLSGFKLNLAFVTFIVGVVGCYSVRHVRQRHDFYRPMLYLCLTYGCSVYLIESLKLTPIAQLWPHVALAVTNGFISPILTIGLLPLFETAFGITTDITLLELSDLNRPLLKRLALEAPGTYHHSIMIGTLAEDAAETIEANSLLARVGSYYHDIGKMLKPEYFVENQLDAGNKHEKLTPTMSAIILEAHVKEGVELAVRNGLPKSIIEFITGHHGTGVMTYFYNKAKQEDDINADIDDFRYPGPNPRSKEVAIVMLADSVEAASRTLDDPKPARIKSLVHRIFLEKLDSGLLENSDLTLRDIVKIENSFVRVLTAFFHRRIKYPEKKEAVS
ncbi:MAG: HDIG domain-containing protein [candidate division Zixibacteria bacterium]|nr:HDIG domain-containing protein [candidate division Zixibacteria bacterium]